MLKGEPKCGDRLARESQRTTATHLRLQHRRRLCLPQNAAGNRLQSRNLANSFWLRQAVFLYKSQRKRSMSQKESRHQDDEITLFLWQEQDTAIDTGPWRSGRDDKEKRKSKTPKSCFGCQWKKVMMHLFPKHKCLFKSIHCSRYTFSHLFYHLRKARKIQI